MLLVEQDRSTNNEAIDSSFSSFSSGIFGSYVSMPDWGVGDKSLLDSAGMFPML